MHTYTFLSPFVIFILMMCAFHPDAHSKTHLGGSETFPTKSGQLKEEDVSCAGSVELFSNATRKRVLREADKACLERRRSRSFDEMIKCPESFCQHVSYSCNMQCPDQNTGAGDCELYNCTGTHHCSSAYEHNIPIEEVCDDIDQCPGSDDESTCVKPCRPSCMCIGLKVNYRSAQRFHLKEITNITNNNDQQTVRFLHLSYLSYLVITDIQTLSESFIRGFNNLKTLDVSNNKLSFLSDDMFRELPSLVSLNLSFNTIKHLSNNVFNGLSGLSELDLSHNHIEDLPGNIFGGLSSLTKLNLSSNHIMHLPEDVFHGLSAISHLNLRQNQIVALSENVFNGLSALSHLDLAENQIAVLPNDVFNGLSALNNLYLFNNLITFLSDNVFNGLSALSHLDLRQNQIAVLLDDVFNGLSALNNLSLFNNLITFLSDKVFNGLSALSHLDLRQNEIAVLPDGVFNGLTALTHLYLQQNQITSLSGNTFNGLSALSYLSFSDNQITELPAEVFYGLSALNHLYLANNLITFLPGNVLNGLSALRDLDLGQNQIKDLPYNVVNGLSQLDYLDLRQNQIVILPDNVFNGLYALTFLALYENLIAVLTDHVFNGLPELRTLDLRRNQITVLTQNVFNGLSALKALDLDGNQIAVLPDHVFNGLSALNNLNLNNNQINVLPDNVFNGMSKLTELYLGQNQIFVLPDDVFIRQSTLLSILLNGNKLSTLPVLPSSVRILDISYNSFRKLHHGSFINNSKMSLLSIVGNNLEVNQYMFEGLDNLATLMTDTAFMCCVRPKSVTEDRCIKTETSVFLTIRNCFQRETSCKSEGDAISSCDALIGSGILKVCLWVIGVCALVGNVSVFIYRLFIDRDNITMSYSLFVLNLSISDFLMGIYLLMIGVADVYYNGVYAWNDQQWRKSVVCTIAGSLSTVSSEMSTFLILLVTIDRVIVIAFPMSRLSRWNISWKQATIISVSLWFVSVALAVIPIIALQSYFKGEYYSQSGVCFALPLTSDRQPGSEYSFAIFVCLNSIIFVVIVIGQICIVKSLLTSDGCITSSHTRQRDMAVARTLFMVVASDFCCWFPIGVMGVMSKTGYKIPNDAYAWVMVFVLPVNAAINPFLYTATAIWRKRQRAKGKVELRKSANHNRKKQDETAETISTVCVNPLT